MRAFGAQFVVHSTNPWHAADFAAAIRHEDPIVITTLGITGELTDAIHAYGGLVFHDATPMKHAKKALDANADGIIAVCAGAVGHAGTYNPFAFITELRQIAGDKTIILAGGCQQRSVRCQRHRGRRRSRLDGHPLHFNEGKHGAARAKDHDLRV